MHTLKAFSREEIPMLTIRWECFNNGFKLLHNSVIIKRRNSWLYWECHKREPWCLALQPANRDGLNKNRSVRASAVMRHYGEEKTESRGEDKEFSATVDPRLSIYRFGQRKAIVLCRKTTINTPQESIHNKYTSCCLWRRCRTKNRGREADMTDGQTRWNVQHVQQRVTFSFDHLHCSDEVSWFVSDKHLRDFFRRLASRYYDYLWFVTNSDSWAQSLKKRNIWIVRYTYVSRLFPIFLPGLTTLFLNL